MMIEPKDLWSILPAALRRQIIDQIAAVLTETRHEIRADPADASGAQGDRLHPAVDASPGRQQLAAVLTETRHEIRADPADASGAQGDRLHPAVDASPGRQQPRKPPPPIRADAARQGSRLARGRR